MNTERFDCSPWAMEPNALRRLVARFRTEVVAERVEWEPPKPWQAGDVGMYPQTAKLDVPRASGAVMVLPLRGVIGQHSGWFTDISTDWLGDALGKLVADDKVGAVVMAWDSPGGIVFGVPELSEQIRGYRNVKPIYSIADSESYSAAYWLGSAATKMFVTPSGGVGSIGVWTAHIDMSKALDEAGYKVTLISAGRYKVEGNPWQELTPEARDAIQADTDAYYEMFVDAVAKNRGKRPAKVKEGFGEGRTVMAGPAMEEGMVDGIITLPELLGAIVPKRRGGSVAAAELAIEMEEARANP